MADSDTDYRLERLTPERLPDLVALHAATYGPGLTLDDARRKFSTATLGHDVIGYLAYDRAGTAAAYYGIFPMRVRLGDRDLLAGQSGDTMTHPDHRGRGLFTKLGRATYDDARGSGIDFVFGFPNSNSYPGFVKHLGWTHVRTMRSYSLPVPTVPVTALLRNRPHRLRRLTAAQRRLLVASRLASPATALRSSVLEGGGAGVVRDAAFLAYKGGPEILTFTQSGVTVHLKLDEHLSVGDLVPEPGARAWGALARLVLIALVCCRYRIRFHTSPDSVSDRLIRGRIPVKDGLPYGHVAFVGDLDPEAFDYTFIDYDTF